MLRLPMSDYEKTHSEFEWEIPETFNFGIDVVDQWAKDQNRTALIWTNENGDENHYTFADIEKLTSQFANLMTVHGIAKGDRILVMLPRIPAWQITIVGCLKAGLVPIPCVTMLTDADITYRLENSEAVGVVTTKENTKKISDKFDLQLRLSIGDCPNWLEFHSAIKKQSTIFKAPKIDAEDPAILYYTSGSAGKPKGVLHAARAIFTWRVSAWYWLTLTENDVMWCTADTGWAKAGTSILFGPWSTGSTVLFYDGPFDPSQRFRLLKKYGVTVFCAGATELRQLIQQDTKNHDLSQLRLTVSAGESVNPEIVNKWRAITGGLLLDGYGQTETLMTVLNYPPMQLKPGSMGRPLPGTDAAILAEDRDKFLSSNQSGRLVIKWNNPQIMIGYWRDPELTAQSCINVDGEEWFITGDTAYQDEDGYLFYQGRDDDLINSSGYRIGPMEVENVLMEHPAVTECAVIGSPDPDRGEVVKAFIILNENFEKSEDLVSELQEFVKSRTAPYKYPRRISFVDELPKTVTGKIQRRKIKEVEYRN